MTLRHMRIFQKIYETQSVTRAAEALHMTQPAVTRALQELEQDGLIRRVDFEEVPPRVEYHLTGKGKAAVPAVLAITDWDGSRWKQMESGLCWQ